MCQLGLLRGSGPKVTFTPVNNTHSIKKGLLKAAELQWASKDTKSIFVLKQHRNLQPIKNIMEKAYIFTDILKISHKIHALCTQNSSLRKNCICFAYRKLIPQIVQGLSWTGGSHRRGVYIRDIYDTPKYLVPSDASIISIPVTAMISYTGGW
jgi:hypothetical protein